MNRKSRQILETTNQELLKGIEILLDIMKQEEKYHSLDILLDMYISLCVEYEDELYSYYFK